MDENNIRKEIKRRNYVFGLIFAAVLILLFSVNLITKDKEASELENRSLQQRPSMTWQGIRSGSYMDRFESWMADQFAGRNAWRRIYTVCRSVGGSRMENGVIVGKQGQLMEDIAVPSGDLLNEDMEGFRHLVEAKPDVKVSVLLVPDAASIMKDRIARRVVEADQQALFEQVHGMLPQQVVWLDGTSAMQKHAQEKLYYLTDHHWTSRGAYDMFLETAEQLELPDPQGTDYRVYPVTDSFNGTLSGMSGHCLDEKEVIDVYLPEKKIPYVVTYVEEQEKTASLYRTAPLETKDKYAVFLGGNYSRIVIDTAAEPERTLLLVKDSFANSFVPFLIPYFRKIVMVDPRYYTGSMKELLNSYSVTDVLFLYSGNTFFQDTNLSGFLLAE